MKLIICGDVHGAGVWKNGLKYFNENLDCKIIFLGDYLDPYTRYEGITQEEALENFKQILKFAQVNKERVILLCGNHDERYRNEERECCRHDYLRMGEISKLFRENAKLFKYAHKEDNYLFTHAGVCSGWLKQNQLTEVINEDNIVDYLNNNPDTIWQIGYSRGGRYNTWGSPLWCCWEGDWPYSDCKNPFNLIQCVGHTRIGKQNFPSTMKDKNIYMFDVQNCFLLDTETGEINLLS